MQIACEVRRVLSKKPNSINPTQFKLQFNSSSKSGKKSSQPQDTASLVARAKSRWLGMMTKKVEIVKTQGEQPDTSQPLS